MISLEFVAVLIGGMLVVGLVLYLDHLRNRDYNKRLDKLMGYANIQSDQTTKDISKLANRFDDLNREVGMLARSTNRLIEDGGLVNTNAKLSIKSVELATKLSQTQIHVQTLLDRQEELRELLDDCYKKK